AGRFGIVARGAVAGAELFRMRTTLKRGIGRASAVNGNGRAVLPPAVLEPMRRYRQPEPPSRSAVGIAARIFGWILLGLLVVASGLAGGLYLFGHETLAAIRSRCNARGTLDTVQKLTGVAVNYLITVDFHGFKLLVNKLHGVYADVDHRYLNTHGGPYGYATINLHPGYQKLDGQEALDFVRFRHTDSDLYRVARQQLFLDA